MFHRTFLEWLTSTCPDTRLDKQGGGATPGNTSTTAGASLRQGSGLEPNSDSAAGRKEVGRRFSANVAAGHEALARHCMSDLQDTLAESVARGVGGGNADGGGGGQVAAGVGRGGGDGETSRFDAREPQLYSLRYALLHLDRAATAATTAAATVAATSGNSRGPKGAGSSQPSAPPHLAQDQQAKAVAETEAQAQERVAVWAWTQIATLVLHLGFWQKVYQNKLGGAVLGDLIESHCFRAGRHGRPADSGMGEGERKAAAAEEVSMLEAARAGAGTRAGKAAAGEVSVSVLAAAGAAHDAVKAAVQWLRLHAPLHTTHPDAIPQTAAGMHHGSPLAAAVAAAAAADTERTLSSPGGAPVAAPAAAPAAVAASAAAAESNPSSLAGAAAREPAARRVKRPRAPPLLLGQVSSTAGGYYTCVSACAPAGVIVAGDHGGGLTVHSLWSGQLITKAGSRTGSVVGVGVVVVDVMVAVEVVDK